MESKSKVRKAIMEAAEHLFSRYGYEKTSIDQITKLSSRAKTSLYYHFDSKLSIFKCCLENEFQTLKDKMVAVRKEYNENSGACLSHYLRERLAMFTQMTVYKSYVTGVTFNIPGGDLKETVDAVREDFDKYEYRYFYDTAQKGRNDGIFGEKVSPDAFAKMMLVLLRGLEGQLFKSKDIKSIQTTFDSLIEVLVDGCMNLQPQKE